MDKRLIAVPVGEVTSMVYRGRVVSGTIQLDGAVILPEGAEVSVELAAGKEETAPIAPTIEEKLRAIVADVPREEWSKLPTDLSDHLDHYIYGTPK
jgi:hypothetical protein